MVYPAKDYKKMVERYDKELNEDCECGCNGAFENIVIGLLVGFIIGVGVILL